jgi:flagella basal body P-ring formation protein FlgA
VPSGTAWVWFDATAPVAGLRYARDLAPGTLLAASDVAPATVDRLRDPDALAADPAHALGLRLTTRVATGDVVAAAALEVAPLVARAERVRVVHRIGAVALETHGTARGDGRLGELIEVLVEGAESPCRARVIGQGVVDVVL